MDSGFGGVGGCWLVATSRSTPSCARRAPTLRKRRFDLMGRDQYELFGTPRDREAMGPFSARVAGNVCSSARQCALGRQPVPVRGVWHQGWPEGPRGYTDLIDGLLHDARIQLRTNENVTLKNCGRYLTELGPYVLLGSTCPLDAFAGAPLGRLDWRGILVRSVHVPHIEYGQGAMVVNYPGAEYPFIRVHEAKHAS